jgi:hypothetical protein
MKHLLLFVLFALFHVSLACQWQIRGINLFPFDADVLAEPATLQELDEIKQMGANYVFVNFMIEQDGPNATRVYTSPEITPTTSSLTKFIRAAHERGLGVCLKPLIVCGGSCTMINVSPSNITEWFESYTAYITAFASFAESLEVEILSVALELILISGQYTNEWENTIALVRELFSGKLTYCSIMWPEETNQIQFWSSLDFISMDTYLPLWNGSGSVPTPQAMIDRFDWYFGLVNNWYESQPDNVRTKPIVLSELGYPSMLQGLIYPYADPPDPCAETGLLAPNFPIQDMAFEACLSSIYGSSLNIQGVNIFWFDTPSSSDYYENRTNADDNWGCGWTVRGKPAGHTIAKYFGGLHEGHN